MKTNTPSFCRQGGLLLSALLITGSLQAAGWNGPGQPRYGQFPPSDIDRQLQKKMDTVSRETERKVGQPSSQNAPVAESPGQTGAQQPGPQQASRVPAPAPTAGAGQPYYPPAPYAGGYPQSGSQYGAQPYAYPPYRGGRWNNNGASFSMPWGNNRRGSGFSMPWNNSGSSFTMPWDNDSRAGRYGAYPGAYPDSGMHLDMPWGNRNTYRPYGYAQE